MGDISTRFNFLTGYSVDKSIQIFASVCGQRKIQVWSSAGGKRES